MKKITMLALTVISAMLSMNASAGNSITTVATWKATAVKDSSRTEANLDGLVLNGKQATNDDVIKEAGYKSKKNVVKEKQKAFLMSKDNKLQEVEVENTHTKQVYYWN